MGEGPGAHRRGSKPDTCVDACADEGRVDDVAQGQLPPRQEAGGPAEGNRVAALAQKQHEVVAEEARQAEKGVTTGGASDLMVSMVLASQ